MSSTPLAPMFADSLVRPDFVTLQVSHDRLELLDEAHCVEAGSDAAQSAKARNSIEKMLCHELAGTHRVINENDSQVNVWDESVARRIVRCCCISRTNKEKNGTNGNS